jgi:hypothetical protein
VHGPDWSVTNPNAPFNPLLRAGINFERLWSTLIKNDDNSTTIYISANPPSDPFLPNWLPSGNPTVDGELVYLTIRLYGPTDAAVQGKYKPPHVIQDL